MLNREWDKGYAVAVLEEGGSDAVGLGIPAETLAKYICWCKTHGIRIYPNVTIDSITDSTVEITHSYGLKESIECNGVKNCVDRTPDTALYDAVTVDQKYQIGTAKAYSAMVTNPMFGTESKAYVLVREAVRNGNLLARQL